VLVTLNEGVVNSADDVLFGPFADLDQSGAATKAGISGDVALEVCEEQECKVAEKRIPHVSVRRRLGNPPG
jgi:hypothetical protein